MNYKHGLTKSKEYILWQNIKKRCYDKNYKQYKDWGGRGIIIFHNWLDNPISFIDYIKSIENYGVENYSLDRIDNDGNYEPGNLRWTDKSTQSINRRIRNTNTIGYVGIHYVKRQQKYQSKININKMKHHIGTFETLYDAVNARNSFIILNNLDYGIQKIN